MGGLLWLLALAPTGIVGFCSYRVGRSLRRKSRLGSGGLKRDSIVSSVTLLVILAFGCIAASLELFRRMGLLPHEPLLAGLVFVIVAFVSLGTLRGALLAGAFNSRNRRQDPGTGR